MEKMANTHALQTTKTRWIKKIGSFFRKPEGILLLCTLLLAAFLRLYKIEEYMTFLGDEGRDVLVVYNILQGKFTLLGPTASVGGFFMGPMYYYFMTPFLWLFNYNPVGPAIMVALVGIATVWLIYKVGKELFGTGTGFIAAILYTISPLVVTYSRSSWNPNVLPFFALLTMYILYKATRTNTWYLFVVTGILFGIDIQLHYVSIALGLAMFFYLLCFASVFHTAKKFLQKLMYFFKNGLLVFAGFLIGWSPFLAFEFRHEFTNLQNMFKFVFASKEAAGNTNAVGTIIDVVFRLFGRLIASFPLPIDIKLYPQVTIQLWTAGIIILIVAALGYFVYRFFKVYKHNKKDTVPYVLIAIWFICGVFFFSLYKRSIYDYYFTFLFPIPFFLTASLLAATFGRLQTKSSVTAWVRKGLVIVLLVILVVIGLQHGSFRHQPNQQKKQMQGIAQFVYEKTEKKPYNFALITPGNSDHAYRYFLTLWGHPPITIQPEYLDKERTTVKDQLLVICESACEPLGNPLWEIAGFGEADVQEKWDVPPVTVYKLVHKKK